MLGYFTISSSIQHNRQIEMCQIRRTIQKQLETVSGECKDVNVGCSLRFVSPSDSAALSVEFECSYRSHVPICSLMHLYMHSFSNSFCLCDCYWYYLAFQIEAMVCAEMCNNVE